MQNKDDSQKILAIVLIAAGFLWLFRMAGQFPFFVNFYFHPIFFPFRHIFAVKGNILFSLQIILILTGIVLIAGRRYSRNCTRCFRWHSVVAAIPAFLLLSLSFLFPALLNGAGIDLFLQESLIIN